MQTIVDINPLKPGKLEAYKAFTKEFLGSRRAEFEGMLKRYGLHTAEAFYHKIKDVDFVIVVHYAEDDARERLKSFATSTHPMEQWFVKQLESLHDFSPLNGEGQASNSIFSLRA